MLAPIIVFVYNRVDRVKKLIESLEANPEAKDSVLYIFSDGAKTDGVVEKVKMVREYIDNIAKRNSFKKVNIIKSNVNKGLATSIIEGVTQVMNRHGKAIIIEDDNIVSLDFLDYMNRGLEYYKDNDKIWAIGGFSRMMTFPEDYNHDVYIMQRISSYTWASWKNRWDKTEWDVKDYPKFLWDRKKRRCFDQCGEDRSLMLDAQMCGKVSSWAIRFEYSMVKNNMYAVLPCVSRAICSGNDGSGTHSTKAIHTFDTKMSDGKQKVQFECLGQNEAIRQEFIKPYTRSKTRKVFGNIDYIFKYYLGQKKDEQQN